MGAWGFKAWENDGAADWFAELHEQTGLRDHVVATLRSGCRVQGEGAVRAAADVMRKLAHVYRWPVRSIESDLRLAVKALGEVRACYALDIEGLRNKSPDKGDKLWHKRKQRNLNKGLKQVDAEIMRLQERLTEMEDRRREREARKMERDNG